MRIPQCQEGTKYAEVDTMAMHYAFTEHSFRCFDKLAEQLHADVVRLNDKGDPRAEGWNCAIAGIQECCNRLRGIFDSVNTDMTDATRRIEEG